MRQLQWLVLVLFALGLLTSPSSLEAQVTTATLVGQLRDTSGAVIPGATVVARHEGTGVTREAITDTNGEFVMSALPNGAYTVKIELTGFKALENHGLELGAGQTVRQTFALQVGALTETLTVAAETPLVETSASLQADNLGSQEVRELPVNRRNLTNLMSLTPGVATSGAGDVQMNGVAAGGTGVTVDGTEANSNPEARSLAQYGGQNQISVMSLDSIAEVQIVKGVLPAEYGGVAGGQINVISRSGTNTFHGSAFYSGQNEKFNARAFYSSAQQPVGTFHQYGGTLGGPILRNKAFFFAAYEGYDENVQQNLSATVPYQQIRDEILSALPFPETKTVLDVLPLPTEPIVSSQGVVDTRIGRWRGLGTRKRTENAPLIKGEGAIFNGGRLAVTYTRLRPFTLEPRAVLNNANDREYPNEQDRVAAQLAATHGRWVSESRVGWNKTYLARLDAFLNVKQPNAPPEVMPYGRRMPAFSITSLFATPRSEIWDMKGITYSFEQKVSRSFQRHLLKAGFRFMRETGGRLNPENPSFSFQTYADLLANIPQSLSTSFGAPPHDSKMDQYSGFMQDDWRLGNRFVLNLGLRYDYYGQVRVRATTDVPVEIVNYEAPTDLRKMDFGALRDPLRPYEPDGNNLAPRAGFAWTVDQHQRTVVRGGVGVLYSPHLVATVRQSAANPFIPFRTVYNRTEIAARQIKWPLYTDESVPFALADAGGKRSVFSLFDPNMQVPYTIQSMISVQRSFGQTMAAEVGYLRTDGRDFPLQRQFTQAFDRETGARPNPALGAPGGYYIDSSQTMFYNGLQTMVHKRFKDSYSWEVTTVGAKVANFRRHRLTERSLDADHGLNGVGNLHVRVEQREDASFAPRVRQSEWHGLVGVQRPCDVSGRNLGSVVNGSEGDERVRRTLSHRRHEVRAIENPDAAADDRSLVLVQGPRESDSRTEIVPVRLVRSQRVPQRTEIHFAQVGRRLVIDDLHWDVRRRSDLDLLVIVVPEAKIQHEAVAQTPIVLNEHAVLIHGRVVRWRSKRRAQRLGDVRE